MSFIEAFVLKIFVSILLGSAWIIVTISLVDMVCAVWSKPQ